VRSLRIFLALSLCSLVVAPSCGGSRTANFENGGSSGAGTSGSDSGGSNGTGDGGANAGGSAGDGAGGSSSGAAQGGSGAEAGADPKGGSSMGGATSGSAGDVSTGGSSGTSATGGVAGAQGGGSGTGGSQAGRGGTAGNGGAPTQCLPESDAMDMCGRLGASCLCCPIGGPMQACICTTSCTSSADCHDASRPICNIDTRYTETGICTPDGFICRWGTRCAAPNTPIATPLGERPIPELRVGDSVYSVEGGAVVVVPILAVSRQPAGSAHTVTRVTLVGGAVLEVSAGHPTADGRVFGDLQAGDELGGVRVDDVVTGAAYPYPFTHDILPDSTSGAYFAAGALIGSTLAQTE